MEGNPMKIPGGFAVAISLVFVSLVIFPALGYAYPKNEIECGTAGGAWVSSGSKGFCYMKLVGPRAGKDCTDSGGIIVKDGRNTICSTSDPDIKASCQKLLEQGASLRGNTIKVVWSEGGK
jgi:hypothetical protein